MNTARELVEAMLPMVGRLVSMDMPAPSDVQAGASAEASSLAVLRLHKNSALNAACRAALLAFVDAFASEGTVNALMREVLGDLGRP